jgi:hypothetical protein
MPRTRPNPSFSPQARPSCFSKAGATNKTEKASEEAKERNTTIKQEHQVWDMHHQQKESSRMFLPLQ